MQDAWQAQQTAWEHDEDAQFVQACWLYRSWTKLQPYGADGSLIPERASFRHGNVQFAPYVDVLIGNDASVRIWL